MVGSDVTRVTHPFESSVGIGDMSGEADHHRLSGQSIGLALDTFGDRTDELMHISSSSECTLRGEVIWTAEPRARLRMRRARDAT